jgi:hypothetical protein
LGAGVWLARGWPLPLETMNAISTDALHVCARVQREIDDFGCEGCGSRS